jgi:hypothetical protein
MNKLKMFLVLPILICVSNFVSASTTCEGNSMTDCHTNPQSVGSSLFKVRDFREVMPGVLYRGGATTGEDRTALTKSQLDSICEGGAGSAYYLYKKSVPTDKYSCTSGKSVDYSSMDYSSSPKTINKRIYKSIHDSAKPVFVHCWYGIHATGFVAATALMQFCDYSASEAVEYWKVGIAKKLQYSKVITQIQNFKRDPDLNLTPAEKDRVCPKK